LDGKTGVISIRTIKIGPVNLFTMRLFISGRNCFFPRYSAIWRCCCCWGRNSCNVEAQNPLKFI